MTATVVFSARNTHSGRRNPDLNRLVNTLPKRGEWLTITGVYDHAPQISTTIEVNVRGLPYVNDDPHEKMKVVCLVRGHGPQPIQAEYNPLEGTGTFKLPL